MELPISVRMSRSNVDRATVKNQTYDIQKGIFGVNSANLVVATANTIADGRAPKRRKFNKAQRGRRVSSFTFKAPII